MRQLWWSQTFELLGINSPYLSLTMTDHYLEWRSLFTPRRSLRLDRIITFFLCFDVLQFFIFFWLQLKNCKAVTSPINGLENAKFQCTIGSTSDKGHVVVPCLPSGVYYAKADYKDGETEFLFAPTTRKVEVKDRATKVRGWSLLRFVNFYKDTESFSGFLFCYWIHCSWTSCRWKEGNCWSWGYCSRKESRRDRCKWLLYAEGFKGKKKVSVSAVFFVFVCGVLEGYFDLYFLSFNVLWSTTTKGFFRKELSRSLPKPLMLRSASKRIR